MTQEFLGIMNSKGNFLRNMLLQYLNFSYTHVQRRVQDTAGKREE